MIAVWCEGEASREATLLAQRLQVPLLEQGASPSATVKFLFTYDGGALFLYTREAGLKPFTVDYLSESFFQRVRKSTKNDLLLRACGLKKGNRTLLDASFGLGYDAVFLSALGFLVTGCERSEAVYEFAIDGLCRLKEEGGYSAEPPRLFLGDSREFLSQYPEERFDVVYYDPMYPRDESGPAARKEMKIFRELVGKDEDANEVFGALCQAARDRVVVKRQDDASPIVPEEQRKPDIIFPGKSARFDVYLIGR